MIPPMHIDKFSEDEEVQRQDLVQAEGWSKAPGDMPTGLISEPFFQQINISKKQILPHGIELTIGLVLRVPGLCVQNVELMVYLDRPYELTDLIHQLGRRRTHILELI